MGQYIIFCVLLLVTASIGENQTVLVFTNSEISVKINDSLHLDCGVIGTYRNCMWVHGEELLDTQDIHDGIYPGLSKPEDIQSNQCGIVLESATAEDHGEWTCKVHTNNGLLLGSKNVTVFVKPGQGKITPAELIANELEEISVECSVQAARPAVQLRWFFDEEDITDHSAFEDTLVTSDGIYMSVSTLTTTFTHADNGKELKCIVDHVTLEQSESIVVPVDVLYSPVDMMPQTFYGVIEGDDFEMAINFSANPKPSKLVWQHGDNFENLIDEVEIPLDNTTLMMTSLTSFGNGLYTAVLNISNLTENDIIRKYNLFVENKIGSTNYSVMLSSDKEPSSNELSEAKTENQEDNTIMVAALITSSVVLAILGLTTAIVKAGPEWLKCCCSEKKDAKADVEGGGPIINDAITRNEKEDMNANENADTMMENVKENTGESGSK